MKLGRLLYMDGNRVGEITYVSADSAPGSRDPYFLSTDKATQFTIVVGHWNLGDINLTDHLWEVGDVKNKFPVRVIQFKVREGNTSLIVEKV